jgi:hypothetical protein
MIETLEKIFGSTAKVKIMRLFLFNPDASFDLEQIAERTKVTPFDARQEINALEKIGMLKKKSFFKDVAVGRKKEIERHRVYGWILDETFEYLVPLRNLLAHISEDRNKELLRKLGRVGKLKLVIISGFFIQNWDSRVDLLVVGDNLKKGTLDNVVKTIESEVGREIRYTAFETGDFNYRLGVYDKLIRDILDFDHEAILDKINIEGKLR